MQFNELSGDLVFSAYVGATAAGTAVEVPSAQLPWAGLITEIRWIPGAAMTANGTNYCTLTCRNRASGAGTVVPATRSWAATNSVATTPEVLTLSSTATDLQLAAGDVLTAHFTHSGTGLAIPAGIVQFKIRLR
jgi:hypothetical protein